MQAARMLEETGHEPVSVRSIEAGTPEGRARPGGRVPVRFGRTGETFRGSHRVNHERKRPAPQDRPF